MNNYINETIGYLCQPTQSGLSIYSSILLIIIILIIVTYGYIKVKYRFWSMQPVFHVYNMLYWIRPPGLIDYQLPIQNRYVNRNNISFYDFSIVEQSTIDVSTKLIQEHYLKVKDAHYNPKVNNIVPYFQGHQDPCFLSTYVIKDLLGEKETIGTMTSRPLHVYLYGKKMSVHYVDHLCVHRGHRNKGIAPELIQTHNYYQCRANPKIMCSLFKKETDLTGIVPLTIYKTYCFDMNMWKQKVTLHSSIQIVEVNKRNIHILHDFLKHMILATDKFSCFIMSSIGNILRLIETKNIFVYIALQKDNILSAYFFRDSSLTYDDEGVLECFCTLNNVDSIKSSKNSDIFVYMFSHALKKVCAEKKDMRYLLIENNSDTKEILVNIMMKYVPMFESPTAYYLYNYGVRPIEEFRVCIIN